MGRMQVLGSYRVRVHLSRWFLEQALCKRGIAIRASLAIPYATWRAPHGYSRPRIVGVWLGENHPPSPHGTRDHTAVVLARLGHDRLLGDALSRFRWIAAMPPLGLLCACHAVVLDPAGDVAAQQRDLLVSSTLLMLLVIVPVMILTVVFAWKYRASNKGAPYDPDWDHSIFLELVIWSAPLLIIIFLGAITWSERTCWIPTGPSAASRRASPYRPMPRRSRSRSWLSTGSGCSFTRSSGSRRSTNWRRRSTGRSSSGSPPSP